MTVNRILRVFVQAPIVVPLVALVCIILLPIGSKRVARATSTGGLGRIVFEQNDGGLGTLHLHTVDPDGTDPLHLRRGKEPDWSPDGSQIAIADSGGSIWVMNANGSGLRILVSDPEEGPASFPSWSPDGNRILFSAGGHSLWIVRIDGKDRRRIPTPGLWGAWQASWSPNGRRVAFVGFTQDPVTEEFGDSQGSRGSDRGLSAQPHMS